MTPERIAEIAARLAELKALGYPGDLYTATAVIGELHRTAAELLAEVKRRGDQT
jgi:hypothetical protein